MNAADRKRRLDMLMAGVEALLISAFPECRQTLRGSQQLMGHPMDHVLEVAT